jgi:hypothetical protein
MLLWGEKGSRNGFWPAEDYRVSVELFRSATVYALAISEGGPESCDTGTRRNMMANPGTEETAGVATAGRIPVWKVEPTPKPSAERGSWLGHLLARRREPTTFQRCLAIHILYAAPRSALSEPKLH